MLNFLNIILIAGVLVSAPLYPKYEVFSVKTLEIWLLKNFQYEAEKGDYWKTPEEMVKDKVGDCEDFAFLNKKILNDFGFESQVYHIYGRTKINNKTSEYSHAICVFESNGKFYYFSNQYFIKKSFDSVKELVEYDCNYWFWYAKLDINKIHQPFDKVWNK